MDGLVGGWTAVGAAGAIALAAAAVVVLRRIEGRRRARRTMRWARDHARRLPWTLFLRRRTNLRLTDERPDARRPLDDGRGSDKIER